jgi:hypothetical protein
VEAYDIAPFFRGGEVWKPGYPKKQAVAITGGMESRASVQVVAPAAVAALGVITLGLADGGFSARAWGPERVSSDLGRALLLLGSDPALTRRSSPAVVEKNACPNHGASRTGSTRGRD